jgi:hypothetical protein
MEIYKKFTPNQNEYGAYYANYLKRVEGLSISEALAVDGENWEKLFWRLDESKVNFAYAEGKWTMSQLILHCIDTERIFAIRALRLLRREKKALTGYDQDDYVEASPASKQSAQDLKSQWEAARSFTKSIYLHADDEHMEFIGNASGYPISARAIGLIIPGHNLHHLKVMREKYGVNF